MFYLLLEVADDIPLPIDPLLPFLTSGKSLPIGCQGADIAAIHKQQQSQQLGCRDLKRNLQIVVVPMPTLQDYLPNTSLGAISLPVPSMNGDSMDPPDQGEFTIVKSSKHRSKATNTNTNVWKMRQNGSAEDEGGGVRSDSDVTHNFFIGHPEVQLTKGVLHLYHDSPGVKGLGNKGKTTAMTMQEERSPLVCLLGVPAAFEVQDLLAFLAPVQGGVVHMRLLRDPSPDKYLALLLMKSQELANQVYTAFNDQPFSLLEPDLCHVMHVGRVETIHSKDMDLKLPSGLTELPACAVCLERLDDSVTGILTTTCNHSFHCECMRSWNFTSHSCPVCRHVQKPKSTSQCLVCGSTEGLWICIICGSVGCGRYIDQHSYQHFVATQHTYAMDLESGRVWDYVGDNYVHRLIQSTTDGKPIELPSTTGDTEEKVDALTLEYTYLLTSQLESQRLFYTERQAQREIELKSKIENLDQQVKELGREREQLKGEMKAARLEHNILVQDLQTEKALGLSLATNQKHWQTDLAMKDQQIAELQEQVRDLMFFIDAQQRLGEATPELQREIR
eukprot:Ihof_evm30s10 gene=Ihof_evmTU30s10